jgi:hypothetical protein
VGTRAGAYHLHLSKLSSLFCDHPLSFARIIFSYKFCFSKEVTGALVSHEELADGARIGWVGLELPPRPLVIGLTPRPTAPGLERGMGLCLRFFDSFISFCLRVL